MQITHVNYKALKPYRQTYHPQEEMRIAREIEGIKAARYPFGYRKTYHISRNAQVRILEMLSEHVGVSHPRFLSPTSFAKTLPGWRAGLQGLYKFYMEIRPKDGRTIVDFMLDHLRVERIEDLPLEQQIKFLGEQERINWVRISKPLKKKLIERLADEARVRHPWALVSDHFEGFVIPEIGRTLVGLRDYYYDNYKDKTEDIIYLMLSDVGIESFDSLPSKKQYEIIRSFDSIRWIRIPPRARLRLLHLLKNKATNSKGMECPHLRALIENDVKLTLMEEIGTSLSGMHDLYRRARPENYPGTTVDYMLDQLGVLKLEDLSFEVQCACLKYSDYIIWESVPDNIILGLLELVKEKNELPHLRYIGQHHLEKTYLPEIGGTLLKMQRSFLRSKIIGDERSVMDVILDTLGVEKFDEMPFSLQIGWTTRHKIYSWARVPDAVIAFYLSQIARSGSGRLVSSDFNRLIADKGSKLLGLSDYLFSQHAAQAELFGKRGTMLDWAYEKYGVLMKDFSNFSAFSVGGMLQDIDLLMEVGASVAEKRLKGGQFLNDREERALIFAAKKGNVLAMDNLVFFYTPLIRKSASKAFVILKQAIEFEELVQIGRIEFQKFVNWYDPGKARFGTYLMNYLHLRIILEARKQLTVVHVPAKVHGQVKDINNARNKLLKDLKREPADIELAEALGITIYELHTRISLTRLNIYLDEPIFEDDESYTRYNLLKGEKFPSPEEVLAKKNLRYSIELAIENSNLDDREKRFIRLYWFEGHVYKDIGAMEKKPLSVERVRQVIQDAFEKIRKGPYGDVLRDIYFDE